MKTYLGTEFDDLFIGKKKAELINGFGGDDVLLGRRGADNIFGGQGDDIMHGGRGIDTFNFIINPDGSRFELGIDRIMDFRPGQDHIKIYSWGITAHTATASYDSVTGNVWVDPDGAGPTDDYRVARLQSGLVLTGDDLLV